jgi:hypothetical protein
MRIFSGSGFEQGQEGVSIILPAQESFNTVFPCYFFSLFGAFHLFLS